MKLLDGQQSMRSAEIKHVLDISWGDFSNHIKSLQEKGFVELVDEFNEDGHISQTVYILEDGRKEFHDLFKLLKQFTGTHSPFGQLVDERAKSFDDDLYPK